MGKTFKLILAVLVQVNWILSVRAFRCYSCLSKDNERCVAVQDSNDRSINCAGGCVSAILSDTSLFRGCISDLHQGDFKQESCDFDLCNADVFPKNRLACYQCTGLNCMNVISTSRNYSQLCRNYVETDSCYIDVQSIDNIVRGCSSNGVYAPSKYRKQCQTSLCNGEVAVKSLTCWECDSNIADSAACKLGKEDKDELGKCKMDVLFGHQGLCYVLHNAEHVRRGCSIDRVFDANKDNIVTCDTNLCNNQEISMTHCHECDSKADSNCRSLKGGNATKTKCPSGTTSCFACRDFENTVWRGCSQPDQCTGSCFSCWNKPLCNSNSMYECYSCSSSDDPNCEMFIHPERIDKEICDRGCQVTLHDDVLVRGCLNETVPCLDDNLCTPCFADDCNNYYIDSECGVITYTNSYEWSTEESESSYSIQ